VAQRQKEMAPARGCSRLLAAARGCSRLLAAWLAVEGLGRVDAWTRRLARLGFPRMGEHLEIELKWGLDAGGHATLATELERLLGAPRRLSQDNRFFDTADRRLRGAMLNLRLRRENEALLMTCKGRAGIGTAGEHRHTEWEEWLDPAYWNDVTAGRIDAARLPLPEPVRQALGDRALQALGGFSNLRLEFRHPSQPEALLCLDRTDFLGQRTDYELEIETSAPEQHAAEWRARLGSWGVTIAPQMMTKFARFLAISGV